MILHKNARSKPEDPVALVDRIWTSWTNLLDRHAPTCPNRLFQKDFWWVQKKKKLSICHLLAKPGTADISWGFVSRTNHLPHSLLHPFILTKNISLFREVQWTYFSVKRTCLCSFLAVNNLYWKAMSSYWQVTLRDVMVDYRICTN